MIWSGLTELAELDCGVAGGKTDKMPTVSEDYYDSGDDVIQVCSDLIRSAANRAKGLHTFLADCTIILPV